MSAPRILLATTNHELMVSLKDRLKERETPLFTAKTGEEALEITTFEAPEIVLLEKALPDMDGQEVCKELRNRFPLIYIVLISHESTELETVVGLEVGADDYVTGSFSPVLLEAVIFSKIRLINRTRKRIQEKVINKELSKVEFGSLMIDPQKRDVRKNGVSIELTPTEYELLLLLIQNEGDTLSRDQIYDQIWGENYNGTARTIDNHVLNLRSKIEDNPQSPNYVRTITGVGYQFL